MTWGTVGTIVGAVVGSVVPGVGTSLGAALGGAIGGMVDQASVPTSRLADLSAPRVSHGAPISLLFGHPRVGGNVIWCSPAIPSGTVGGSKGDGGGTETYVRHVLVMLGEGVTGPPTRIWAGGKLIHNRLATADDETLEASVEEAVIGEVIYYDGRDTQLPDPTYALAVGEDNAPAYRGKSTVMLKDFSVGTGGQLPPTTIEVSGVAAGTVQVGGTRRILKDVAQAEYRGDPPEGSSNADIGIISIWPTGVETYQSDGPGFSDNPPGNVDLYHPGQGNGDIPLAVFGVPGGITSIAWAGSGHSVLVTSPDPDDYLGSSELRFSTFDGDVVIASSVPYGDPNPALPTGKTNKGKVYVFDLDGTPLKTIVTHPFVAHISSVATNGAFVWVYGSGQLVTFERASDWAQVDTFAMPAAPGIRVFVSEAGELCYADEAANIYRRAVTDADVPYWDLVTSMADGVDDAGDPLPVGYLGTANAHHMIKGQRAYAVVRKYGEDLIGPIERVYFIQAGLAPSYHPQYGRPSADAWLYDFAFVNGSTGAHGITGWVYSFTWGGGAQPRDSSFDGIELLSRTLVVSPPSGAESPTYANTYRVKALVKYGYPGDSGQPPGMYPDHFDITVYECMNRTWLVDPAFYVDVYRKHLNVEVYDLAEPTLQEVVEHLCTRAGLLPISVDATELATKRVHAFALTQIGATSSALELLMSVYRFYCVESGGKLVFRFAGAGSVRSIPHADLGASWSEPPAMPLPLTRGNPQELPSMESVRYANIDDDYQDGLESSDRLMQSVQSARTVEYAIGLHPDEAKQLAAITQQVAQTALVRIGPVSLGPEHREVEAGDVITLGLAGGGSIQMLTAATDYDRGIITAEGVRYDEADYTSDAVTANAYTPSMTVRRPPDTMAVLIDPPLWSDASDGPSFWVAAKPSRYPWRGYSLQRSASDVGYTEVYRDGHTAVFGECTTILPAWDGGRVVDWKSSVTVDVGAGQLSSITRAELLTSRANLALIGGEMLQYQTADLVATGVYTLTGFVRHLGGTEKATHGAGETFALLDTLTMTRVPVSLADAAVPAYYRAVTLGRSLETASPVVFDPSLVSLIPLAPANLRAVSLPDGDLYLRWNRRTRYQSNSLRGNVPLGETAESYEIEIEAPGGAIETFSATSSPVLLAAGAYRPRRLASAIGGGRWGVELGGDVFAMRDYQLSWMDGATLETLGRTGFPPSVMGLATDGANLFVCHLGNPAGGLHGQLVKLSPTLAALGSVSFPLIADGSGVTYCDGSIWVSLQYSGVVRRYSTALATVADVTVSPEVCRLTTDGVFVYVVDKVSPKAYKIDPSTNTVVLTITLSSQPASYTDIAATSGRLFVTEFSQVMVYDTTTGYQDLSGPPIPGQVVNAVGSDVAIQNGLDFSIYDAATLTRSALFTVVAPTGALSVSGTLLDADRLLIDNTSEADYYEKSPVLSGSVVRVRQISASVGPGHSAILEI
jgi:hypothetical protein